MPFKTTALLQVLLHSSLPLSILFVQGDQCGQPLTMSTQCSQTVQKKNSNPCSLKLHSHTAQSPGKASSVKLADEHWQTRASGNAAGLHHSGQRGPRTCTYAIEGLVMVTWIHLQAHPGPTKSLSFCLDVMFSILLLVSGISKYSWER